MNIFKTTVLAFFFGSASAICQVSFWGNSTIPATPDTTNDSASLTLGVQFYSDTPGTVTGVRFYKGTGNTGQHTGALWSSTGTLLAQVTFANETASGWQQAKFGAPVSIVANAKYVISYFAPKGNYAVNPNYSWSTLNSPPLHPASSAAGVYTYGSTNAFPTGVYQACNYWVDAVFTPSTTTPPPPTATSSFWTNAAAPLTADTTGDSSAVTLGLKFSSDTAGSILGVRFYKGSNNGGPHLATLWSSTGTKLAEVTVTGETTSGWQQASFSTPVSILANTTYLVSYYAPKGNYAFDGSYAWSALNATPLHVVGSSPGVYGYGSGGVFPQATYLSGNYWVDPVFSSTTVVSPTFNISGTVTGTAATLTLSGASSQLSTTNGSGQYAFTGLANGTYVVAPSQPGYTFNPTTTAIVINGASSSGVNFTGTPTPHSVSLAWTPSNSPNILGFNVYRSTTPGGPYAKMTSSPISGNAFVDSGVSTGHTYYYAATELNTSNMESAYSNIAVATMP